MRFLTAARDLARRKARERDGLFVVEGVRATEELLRSSVEAIGVLCGPQLGETARGAALSVAARARGVPISEVTEREFASAAATESPQGVLAIARVPARNFLALRGRDGLRLLVLDAIQDPGNVGTLIRTAHALGADATIALPGTVDVWNAKVVRSSMGAIFFHHAMTASFADLSTFLGDEGVELWAADVGGAPLGTRSPGRRVALVVGNEGSGLTPAVRSRAVHTVSLPIAAEVESLNVAVAAGILLYGLRP